MGGDIQMRTPAMYIIAILVAGAIWAIPAKAFGPLAHHVAVPVTGMGWETYQNLPDLWKSWGWGMDWELISPLTVEVDFFVSSDFGWSHACQKKGVTPAESFTIIGLIPPVYLHVNLHTAEEPTIYGMPPGVETPESDMLELCSGKLSRTPSEIESMSLTAKGFLCHNVQDLIVHWSYFQAGSAWRWGVEHVLKEMWVEYDVFDSIGGTYDIWGHPEIPETFTSMGATGDPGIINLAQKVFRKNRQNVAFQGYPREAPGVESSSTIAGHIAGQNSSLGSYVGEFRASKYSFLNQVASLPETSSHPATNWTPGEGYAECLLARQAATIAINAIP
jgi:hypothetical protein